MEKLTCFKAYDVRGRLGHELNEEIAYRIGRAYAAFLNPKSVVVGGDIRESSKPLKQALTKGLRDEGVDVLDIGVSGTEEIYFAAQYLDVQGGIEITASHNPIDFNGMKFVREGAKPISGDTGLKDIQQLAELNQFPPTKKEKGSYEKITVLNAYINKVLSFVDTSRLNKPLKLIINSGNGAAGHVIDALEEKFDSLNLPIELIKLHHEPDSTFPNGIPNPLLVENRKSTSDAVLAHKADMGIAFDGDFDRCFFFDEQGQFIEGYYIVGLLAEMFLKKSKGEKIIHDPRLTWNTINIVKKYGGIPVQSKTGHAFIKEKMREEDAIYGGEMSAHHYFRDFSYCDSGIIPWLLVVELICNRKLRLSELVSEGITAFPSSGEINIKVSKPEQTINSIKQHYEKDAINIDLVDGLSMEFNSWRFNLRMSNTEPVIRLNIETKENSFLVEQKIAILIKRITKNNVK